jgi:thiamine biosynthesis lipoprotein
MISRHLIALSLLLSLLAACQKTSSPICFAGIQMQMEYQVLVGQPLNRHEQAVINQLIKSTFEEVDAIYNNWNPASEITILNRLPADQAVPLSSELETLLKYAGRLVMLTEGRFDPTVALAHSRWRTALEDGRRLTAEEQQAMAAATGWNLIHFSDGLFWKEHADTAIDLCGIAKGYTVDLLVERLNAAGFANVHVTWSGEIRATGKHPTGRAWTAALRSPAGDSSAIIESFPLCDRAVATSGDYQQYWLTDQGTYTHLCDPRTLQALSCDGDGVASATVVAPTCWLADGLATAAMLAATCEEAEQLVSDWETALPDVHILILFRNSPNI